MMAVAFQQHAALAVGTGGIQAGNDLIVLADNFQIQRDLEAPVGEDDVGLGGAERVERGFHNGGALAARW